VLLKNTERERERERDRQRERQRERETERERERDDGMCKTPRCKVDISISNEIFSLIRNHSHGFTSLLGILDYPKLL
jgi:hypothetical protein